MKTEIKQNMIGSVSMTGVKHALVDSDSPRFVCYEAKAKEQPFTYIHTETNYTEITCKACIAILKKQGMM